ncbi:hypothetical protein M0R88_07010 [Halorussus gelatinilyticus]|uniref:Uncharacterized protein n=1 Tax=Halorussus gelatinilyticus TaxID=2937524 RepID=A0A8U0IMD6_9EURY|nr:hypothetical protein [Halorussus gelatinilyticus]UPW02297.1 hypothetical protein M0R88_07010 [Halorussus gelatinilyticus]
MGEFADAVRDRLRDTLAERRPSLDWETECRVRRTPIDVVGTNADRFVAVELEWRRADPANNTAKLFYYADEGAFGEYDDVLVCQLFSGYYDLQSGGVSSKREVAEFVGETAAESVEYVAFHPFRLPIDPPKRGGERPAEWRTRTDETAAEISALFDG